MSKSMLTTVNQIMSIASKAHYLSGGNASKILAKDKKGMFTLEQVSETLQCDPTELKALLQQNQIMCGDYVINDAWGNGTKLSTFALRTLSNNVQNQSKILDFLKLKKPQPDQKNKPWAVICAGLWFSVIPLLIFDHPLIAILNLLISIALIAKPAYKQIKGE